MEALVEAKAAVISLVKMPYQRSWVEALQKLQLKREVAGTSKIEGADFSDKELELALEDSPDQLLNRSQRQARAAMLTYKWIAELEVGRPINRDLIVQIHRLIVTHADDDHCSPGQLRGRDTNVHFGVPPHRGGEGGEECEMAFNRLVQAVNEDFRGHDLLIQALATHYHFAALHPFVDGNGRTARALEALMLRRAGLTDHLFIAMSNYYYDEKNNYLTTLSAVSAPDFDLTPFLVFGLQGIKSQCYKLLDEIRLNVEKSIFRNTMFDLYGHLRTQRQRVIKNRHTGILGILLERGELKVTELFTLTNHLYGAGLKAPHKARLRDFFYLSDLGAIQVKKKSELLWVSVNLSWPKTITENGFLERVKAMPKSKTRSLAHWPNYLT